MELEDEPDRPVPEGGKLRVGRGEEGLPPEGIVTGVGGRGAEEVQQRALADAGGPEDGDQLPLVDGQVEAAQDLEAPFLHG